MQSTTALPPKAKPVRCTVCGLTSSAPIIVAALFSETVTVQSGRCSNRDACKRRQLRAKNKAKEAKS